MWWRTGADSALCARSVIHAIQPWRGKGGAALNTPAAGDCAVLLIFLVQMVSLVSRVRADRSTTPGVCDPAVINDLKMQAFEAHHPDEATEIWQRVLELSPEDFDANQRGAPACKMM